MRTVEALLADGDPAWGRLRGLLQAGVDVPSTAGLSLREFMRDGLGFPEGYIEASVSTVFLDGQPVDDIDRARVAGGSLVALSAAMPGLVGAVMRRNSPYASFREGITWEAGAGGAGRAVRGACTVTVKLFNSVMRDRGGELLSRGIIATAGLVAEVLGEAATGTAGLPSEAGESVLLRLRSGGGQR
jgi:hypothetical protein